MLPMFLAVVDQTIVATALPAIAASLGSVERVSWVVVAYLRRRHHRRARLRPAARRLRRQAHDVRGARHLPRGLGAVRRADQHRDAGRRARPAGAGRRRADDAVAGADRRDHPAARARPLPGLSRRRRWSPPPPSGRWPAACSPSTSAGARSSCQPAARARSPCCSRCASSRAPGREQPWSFDGMGLVLFIAFIAPVLLALRAGAAHERRACCRASSC